MSQAKKWLVDQMDGLDWSILHPISFSCKGCSSFNFYLPKTNTNITLLPCLLMRQRAIPKSINCWVFATIILLYLFLVMFGHLIDIEDAIMPTIYPLTVICKGLDTLQFQQTGIIYTFRAWRWYFFCNSWQHNQHYYAHQRSPYVCITIISELA